MFLNNPRYQRQKERQIQSALTHSRCLISGGGYIFIASCFHCLPAFPAPSIGLTSAFFPTPPWSFRPQDL